MCVSRSFACGYFLLASTATMGFMPSVQRQGLLSARGPVVTPSACSWNVMLRSTTGSSADLLPGIEAIQQNNAELLSRLEAVRESDYFRLYSVDILGSCEYMAQELFECYTESCEIYPVDDEAVPPRIKEIDRKYGFELDGWGRWDMPTEDYYDIQEFEDGYTGYDGSEVWDFIHNKICFRGYGYGDEHWKADFNKAVSGMHSIVSAQVIRGIQDKIDSGEGFAAEERWTNPSMEFSRRLSPNGETPQAIENLYFLSMLLLCAVAQSKQRILDDQRIGCIEGIENQALQNLFDSPLLSEATADKVSLASKKFQAHATKDKESAAALWEARMRTRELFRIMNCVQCNKCRLHGKIVGMGVSTALQILLGWNGEGQDPQKVQRVEIATLLTTLDKCTRAIDLCQKMQS